MSLVLARRRPPTRRAIPARIELPVIRPDVTRVRLLGGRCTCCREHATATAHGGLKPGSPFGNFIETMAVYLHYAHAIGLERLRGLFAEVFHLSISGIHPAKAAV